MRLLTIIKRSCRLRCPGCGGDKLFHGWFRMHAACQQCGRKYERAPGFFLGSIYFNYGVTALLVVVLATVIKSLNLKKSWAQIL